MFPILGINIEWVLIIVIGIVGIIVQVRLQSVFKKYSHVMFPGGLTGREVAEKMLRDNGIYDVQVTSTPGHLTDHYDPRNKTVNLSESVYNSNSVAAAAVAAHECGHAVQHAQGYVPLEVRSAGLCPAGTAFTSGAADQFLVDVVDVGHHCRHPADQFVPVPLLDRNPDDRPLGTLLADHAARGV